MELELRINGVITSEDVAPNETLLSLLRRSGYYSVKRGCETGACGACTVMVEDQARPSCVMLAAQAGGCSLMTVEGLNTVGSLHPLQAAFAEVGAAQCGFCTSGILISAFALLKQYPHPTEEQIRDALTSHLCSCTGYDKLVQAVMRAAAVMRGEEIPALEYNLVNAIEDQGRSRGRLLSVLAGNAASASGSTMQMAAIKPDMVNAAAATTLPEQALTSQQFQVVGQPLPNLNALKTVTGKARFSNDTHMREMLYAGIYTSPHAHAIISDIDVSAARALPGVFAVLTYKDIPRRPFSSVEEGQPGKGVWDRYSLDYLMRYVGDRVALVAAESPETVAEALKLIEVTFEQQPAILDPRQAVDATAPRLHPEGESRGIFDATRNIAARVRSEIGDVDLAFARADMVVEGEYIVSPSHAVSLETHTVITYIDNDDCLVVQTNCQAIHHVQRTLSRLLGLPARRIRVIQSPNGGPNGHHEMLLEDACALLTMATGRPVLLSHSRADTFMTQVRPLHVLRVKTGVKRDGTIVANQIALLADTGAYATHPLIWQANALTTALGLYPCANMRFIAEILYSNHPPAGAFVGSPLFQEFFALESHMDEIAQRLNIDALELRRKNWIKVDDAYPLAYDFSVNRDQNARVETCGLSACLQKVEEKLRWSENRRRGRMHGRFRRGIGVALSMQGNPGGQSYLAGAMIKLNEDGSFDIFVNLGETSGGSTTMIAQIAAEVLGVSINEIQLHTEEASIVPLAMGASGATTLYAGGGAVRRAAEQLRRQILTVAGRILNTLPESLKVIQSQIGVPGGQQVSLADVASHALYTEGRQLMTTASWKLPYAPLTFAVNGVEVEVDTETGSVRLLKIVSAVDVGRAINPLVVEAQIQSQITQALGTALSEELIYDANGALLLRDLSSYRVFAAPDMPALETYLVETDDTLGPFGAKNSGIVPFYGIAPALANAIADALTIRMRYLPLSPERILRALHAYQSQQNMQSHQPQTNHKA